MHRLITRLLILFTLLANLGWVADMYLVDQLSEHAEVIAADDHQQDDCPPGIDCHHCCHATVHLLTIPGTGLALCLATGQRLGVAVDTLLHSFIPAPPYQPPRA